MRRINFPKRIRLGLPQKPHGPSRFYRLASYQREWLEARQAAMWATALETRRARVAQMEAQPLSGGLIGMLQRRMEIAEASMAWHLEFAMFGPDVDLREMPRSPP